VGTLVVFFFWFHRSRPLLIMTDTVLYIHELLPPLRMSRVVTPQPRAHQVEASYLLSALNGLKIGKEIGNRRPSSLAPSSAICARCSSRSLRSHSETSLSVSSASATGGPAVLPTAVIASNSRTARLHRSSANSPASLVRSLVLVEPGCFCFPPGSSAGSSTAGNF